jgi:hypothetical protein
MTTIIRDIDLFVSPGVPMNVLLQPLDVCRCPRPSLGAPQGEHYQIRVLFIGFNQSFDGANALRHTSYEALFDRKLRFLTNYEALSFNAKYPIVQWEHPFIIRDYAFGIPGRDPHGPQMNHGSLELSTIEQFAHDGTSRFLRIAATVPTAVDRECFQGEIIHHDFMDSMQRYKGM